MNDWHLVCVSSEGVVSILRNLDRATALETYRRLMPHERPWEIRAPDCEMCRASGTPIALTRHAMNMRQVEAIGPKGEEFRPWDDVEPDVFDLVGTCRHPKAPSKPPLVFDDPERGDVV